MKRLLSSRHNVLLGILALLVLLDVARSVYARVGFSQPASIWQPDPKVYADMQWPPVANVPANASTGQRVYVEHCALCHGPDGRGNGPAAPSMIPRPRDFVLGQFKYKSTPTGQPPSDTDLYNVIANGLQASGMPYWRGTLKDEEIRAVVDYIKTLSPIFRQTVTSTLTVPAPPVADAASIARGQALYTKVGCVACHGADLRGGQPMADAKGYPVISRDLTATWTFRGGSEPEQIWLRLTTGLAPSPMPSFAGTLSPQERYDLVNFIRAKARPAPWANGGKLAGPGQLDDAGQRGRYLVHAEMCGLCHTEVDPHGIYRDDRYLAGGMRVQAYPQGIFISRNLTPDPETGLGKWSETQIAEAIRNGHAPNRLLNFWGMPWMYLHTFTPQDALAIAHYLKTLPPVHSQTPLPLHFGFIETVVNKLRTGKLLIAPPPVLTYAVGSYANKKGISPNLIEQILVWVQIGVLVLGILLFIVAAPKGRRAPHGFRGWSFTILGVLILLVLGLVGAFVYNTPVIGALPPDRVAAGATEGIHHADVTKLPAEQAQLVQRGEYLFTTASCAYCHGNNGSGGSKLSGGAGSIWTPNISSDPKAGVGAWTDAELVRAIRSGVSRDGRPLYWQGMPWDHFSNWDEEDIRSIIAYLRTLPPIAQAVPSYRPPAADDCKIYAFWTSPNFKPGCE